MTPDPDLRWQDVTPGRSPVDYVLPPQDGTRLKRREAELCALMNTEAIGKIVSRYERKGGERYRLCTLLLWLIPSVPPINIPYRKLKRLVTRCVNSLASLQKGPELPDPLREAIGTCQRELQQCLEVWEFFEQMEFFFKKEAKKKPLGRPRGPTAPSILLAILAKEFQRRFGTPRYRDILTLVKAVAPGMFPDSTAEDHIRQRIHVASKHKEVTNGHRLLFG